MTVALSVTTQDAVPGAAPYRTGPKAPLVHVDIDFGATQVSYWAMRVGAKRITGKGIMAGAGVRCGQRRTLNQTATGLSGSGAGSVAAAVDTTFTALSDGGADGPRTLRVAAMTTSLKGVDGVV